ncbi:GNAT family N-acetyltransferase [Pleionea sp. CnH1-48]|uniref:GNAT family N-acetyltransferase n=1 Tax=Pleionea sp. CnH1-48 TaxID=2954494 RepID=UPI0020968AF4|nr:GNAT family N-acetyltransferase [Pleionea sp. CnH1-48]MCO7223048.1 GNAT family N-acetyltransferase [Pleionea sp. CnH1-48]
MSITIISRTKEHFETSRLMVESCQSQLESEADELSFAKAAMNLLTPKVTETLPEDWQWVRDSREALRWLQRRCKESRVFSIRLREQADLIGMLFLHHQQNESSQRDWHIGYFIGESYWSKGYASEVIEALVIWAKKEHKVRSLLGAVSNTNIGSIKVLEKNGFARTKHQGASEQMIFFERVL